LKKQDKADMIEEFPKRYLYKRIIQAKLFIDYNFSEQIDLDNIANEACFSKFHFTRLFKKIYNQTPHQYLTLIRIEKAKQYLSKDNNSVANVCFAVGFDSTTSFTGLFKKAVGLPPVEYQQLQIKHRIDILKSPLNYIPNCFAKQRGWTQ
jgi:AraC-like DNA-binding protein